MGAGVRDAFPPRCVVWVGLFTRFVWVDCVWAVGFVWVDCAQRRNGHLGECKVNCVMLQ